MKKGLVCLLVVAGLSATQAMASSFQVLAKCSPQYPQPDQGYLVSVMQVFGPVGPGFKPVRLQATVSVETIAGPRPVGNYKVRYVRANPRLLGSSPSYQGDGFALRFFTDGPPRPDGKTPAVLEARTAQGHDISEKLLCSRH